jgi:selenide,water dikinase
MAAGPRCGLRLFAGEVHLLPGAAEYAAMGLVPEGAWRNREGRLKALRNYSAVSPELLDILFDPQTSGGLLAALPAAAAREALDALTAAGEEARLVGESGGPRGEVAIVP